MKYRILITFSAMVFFSGLVFRIDVAPEPAPSPSPSGSGDDCSLAPRSDAGPGCSLSLAHANVPPPFDDCKGLTVGTPCRNHFEKPGTCEYTCNSQKNSATGKNEFKGCLECKLEKPCADPKDCPEKKEKKNM